MPVTDGKIQIVDNDGLNPIEISLPSFGYKTTILLPFDIQKLDTGKYDIYDHGSSYDIRKCNCTFLLNVSDQNSLNDFLKDETVASKKGRAYDVTIRMNTGSGFFPFGPDKGDVGDFDIAMYLTKHGTVGESPFQYFICDIEMVHTGTFPAYALPDQVSEGLLTIGTITNCRFPPNWFEPAIVYGYAATLKQGGAVEWIDRGEYADWYETYFEMHCNESKAAAILNYIIGTSRSENFNITSQSGFYPFGRDKSDGTFAVKLIQDKIEIIHNNYNYFTFPISLSYVSG